MQAENHSKASTLFIGGAVASCALELFWFGSRCIHQIDYDGMAYVGIARHLREGDLYAAINAFRSPLLSWLIAMAAFASPHYLRIGKLINIGAFLLCAVLLFVFTRRLWHSKLAASVSIFLFVLGRGLAASAVEMITPDFLFAVLTLVYFIVLLRCFRDQQAKDWFYLGLVHGLAFLAKGFALPWLALCTLVALLLSGGSWKAKASRLGLAALIPLLAAVGWAAALHSKYGVITAGSQFKANLLQWTLHATGERHGTPTYMLLTDTTKAVDDYVVDDPMPPGSWPWKYQVRMKQVLPLLLLAEGRNLPRVMKEMTIVATPGALLAFVAALAIVTRRRVEYFVEWQVAAVIAASALSLALTYSMLVFDARYLFPLIPLILAVAARFLITDRDFDHNGLRRISIALVLLGMIISLAYPSSPFRLLTRDFQASCYDAGNRLRAHSGSRLVSIGSGPSPEHGVGWEAGYKAGFFARWRIVGATDFLPDAAQLNALIADISKASPDAVLVWGRPDDTGYKSVMDSLLMQYPKDSSEKIVDPALGEVGSVMFTAR